ncbi:MAG: type II toxin-antitoxin system RelE/ParE family toxin [Myxococcaceae bacterium]
MISLDMRRFWVREYLLDSGKSPYEIWLQQLDKISRARIQAWIFRLEQGNLGDSKSVGNGVLELRFTIGPGYRVYFGIDGNEIILLLLGGDKSTQRKDILRAQLFWRDYLEGKNNG